MEKEEKRIQNSPFSFLHFFLLREGVRRKLQTRIFFFNILSTLLSFLPSSFLGKNRKNKGKEKKVFPSRFLFSSYLEKTEGMREKNNWNFSPFFIPSLKNKKNQQKSTLHILFFFFVIGKKQRKRRNLSLLFFINFEKNQLGISKLLLIQNQKYISFAVYFVEFLNSLRFFHNISFQIISVFFTCHKNISHLPIVIIINISIEIVADMLKPDIAIICKIVF